MECGSIDASDIEVAVSSGEVTLTGSVQDRDTKREAEDMAEGVLGVTNVQNNLRVKKDDGKSEGRSSKASSTSTMGSSTTGSSTTGSSTGYSSPQSTTRR